MTMTPQTSLKMPKLSAESRESAGKGEARRLRRPAWCRPLPTAAASPRRDFVRPKAVAAILRSELGKNTVIELQLGGDAHAGSEPRTLLAMIRDYALHPVKRELEHIDFVEVKLDRPVDVQVPLRRPGQGRRRRRAGGSFGWSTASLQCAVCRNGFPVKIETDVTHLELGQHIATQDS